MSELLRDRLGGEEVIFNAVPKHVVAGWGEMIEREGDR
jgi:hypothetical protein